MRQRGTESERERERRGTERERERRGTECERERERREIGEGEE